MSLRYLDGCDTYTTDGAGAGLFLEAGGTPTIVAGRTGNCIQYNGTRMRLGLPANGIAATEYYTFGCAMFFPQTTYTASLSRVIAFTSGGNDEQQIHFDNGGVIQASMYSQNSRGRSAPGAYPLNQWFYLEAQVRHHDSLGIFKIWINGVLVVNFGPGDTKYNWPLIDAVILEGYHTNARYDDIYLCTDVVPDPPFGDCGVDLILPNGNGAASQWMGSDSNQVNNWDLVDEVGMSMTDYVASGVAGQQDLYTFTDLPGTTGTIQAVGVVLNAHKDEIGARSVKPLVRRTATNAGTAMPLEGNASGRQAFFFTDPETGAAWTQSNINAAQFGIELV